MPSPIWMAFAWVAVALAGGLTWWRHRKHLVAMQRRLAWSEESRFELVKHAEVVDARLAEMSRTLAAQQQALHSAGVRAARSAAVDALMAKAIAAPPTPWADTQPCDPADERGYAETVPDKLAAAPTRAP